MMCIFLLAKDVLGGRFIRKKETSKRAKSEKRCYNYFTDKQVVEVAIELMNWNLRNLLTNLRIRLSFLGHQGHAGSKT